jgi:hypothetical protein
VKTTIEVMRNPNPQFAGVACLIAKGEPPEWLILGLEHFSAGIVAASQTTPAEHKQLKLVAERMCDAADTLLRYLPAFKHLPYGIQCPDDVRVVLDALPRIRADFDRVNRSRPGRRPNGSQNMCAAVVVEAWKMIHGKAETRSDQLYLSCKEYWVACGCEERGETDDLTNWRRNVEKAIAVDNEWVRSVLTTVQNQR